MRILMMITMFCLSTQWALGAESFPDKWFYPSSRKASGLKSSEGKKASDLDAAKWIGNATTLSANQGKVIVLDFWATWCGPCVKSIPKNIKMVQDYKDKGLIFIGVHSASSGWDKAPAMIRDRSINYPVALDAGKGNTAKAYHISFLPTYVVIDRKGVVRAAGLLPGHVEDVVKQLLAEDAPATNTSTIKTAEFSDQWYYAQANRPKDWKTHEGQKSKPIRAKQWIGQPHDPKLSQGQVQLIHFTRPELTLSRHHLKTISDLAKVYGKQGVMFTVVCDSQSDWNKMKQIAAPLKPNFPIAMDRPVALSAISSDPSLQDKFAPITKSGRDKEIHLSPNQPMQVMMMPGGSGVIMSTRIIGNAVPIDDDDFWEDTSIDPTTMPSSTSIPPKKVRIREAGLTAKGYGVRFAPVTVVIDRSGKVRAIGIKLEHVKDVLNKLLTEQYNAPAPQKMQSP